MTLSTFVTDVVQWQQQHGRHHLPWQHTTDPYRIWLSEIMLQQTQVTTVLSYYARFLERFPTIDALAQATQEQVMPYWAGLGYYARARNLHRCAQAVVNDHHGHFPTTSQELATLPGIGPSTAAAIAAFAYGERAPIMDGNVKRVFSRYFGIYGLTHLRATEKQLWAKAHEVLASAPKNINMAAYTQGQMDLGAQICTRNKPQCPQCPLAKGCFAYAHQTQAELPTPKPTKRSPQRYAQLLIWQQAGQVLVEQRPNTGIWGGLISLPQFDDSAAMHSFMRQQGLAINQLQALPVINHIFSHFKLQLQPWLYTSSTALRESQPHQHWLAMDQLQQAALPAPIYTLLSHL